MDLDRDKNLGTTQTGATVGTERMDNDVGMTQTGLGAAPLPVTDTGTGRSNFMAYLIGGLVIAVGLLAFLFYDGGTRDVNTTSSTRPSVQAPATPTSPSAPAPGAPAPAR